MVPYNFHFHFHSHSHSHFHSHSHPHSSRIFPPRKMIKKKIKKEKKGEKRRGLWISQKKNQIKSHQIRSENNQKIIIISSFHFNSFRYTLVNLIYLLYFTLSHPIPSIHPVSQSISQCRSFPSLSPKKFFKKKRSREESTHKTKKPGFSFIPYIHNKF